jgi:hypothetical protein
MDRVKKKLSYLLQKKFFENFEKKMFCRILKQNYGHFDEKCVGGNDVFIKKIASCIGLHQNFLMFIATEFSKLSIKAYKPVGGALKSTI